jgi:hypothetical protein
LALFSFDSLVGNEPFQEVALTPWGKKSFPACSAPEKQQQVAIAASARRNAGILAPRNRRGLDPIFH